MRRSNAAALIHAPTAELRRLRAQNLSCAEIGRRFGLTKHAVWKRLRIGPRRANDATTWFDATTCRRAVRLYAGGLGLVFVARFLGLKSINTTARCLRAWGVRIRSEQKATRSMIYVPLRRIKTST